MNLRWLLILVAVAAVCNAGPSPEQKRRIDKLENSLLAPCCYSEPVARHRSEVSLAMRAEIEKMVLEGESDRDILDHYKSLYGIRVLVEPEGARWWWMHVVPVVVAVLGLLFVVYLIRRMLRPIPVSSQ